MSAPRSRLSGLGTLGDFTASPRMLVITGIAVVIALAATGLAWLLLRLISVFTNVFFFQQFSVAPLSPADHHLGPFVILVPVIGATIVGLMARYGSERIRGHGIPEAIETILMNGSRAQPKLVLLKPLSAAISIGSGGPFGAEGPIIMTAGSFGSLVAQLFHLTASERKTLLVAGAAAGMSATFSSPLAATLLAVELLLFEWKPRSLVPVAIASITAYVARRFVLGPGPLFPVPPHAAYIGFAGLGGCLIAGIAAGALSYTLTNMVYKSEDAFAKLPIHWMWWPPIGGLIVGIGGWIFPQALGVGYAVIGGLLQTSQTLTVLLGVLVVKSIIWATSLGSGTSGGVLAPLLMIGCALGGLEALALPNEGIGFWPLVSMAAVLGGTMRAPFTAVAFALELTHDFNMAVPLLLAVVVAHAFTVLTLPRSILTEKIARRGFHLSREYTVDPLEILFVRDVMSTRGSSDRVVVPPGSPVVAPDTPLRVVAYRMAETSRTQLPVVDRKTGMGVGVITVEDLLKGRTANLHAESFRERHISIWSPANLFGRDGDEEDGE